MRKVNGLEIKKNANNGFTAVKLHYSASKDRGEEWVKKHSKGMPKDGWDQDYEINFTRAGGRPMFADFDIFTHVKPIRPSNHFPLIIGLDFGFHHPAAVFAQKNHLDQLLVLREYMPHDVTVDEFAKHILLILKKEFPFHFQRRNKYIEYYGDPAGTQVNDKSEHTTIQLLRLRYKMLVRYKRLGKKQGIRMIQERMLKRSDMTPGMLIDPSCKILIEGFSGGYQELPVRDTSQSKELPHDDDFYSHTQDALRYIIINKFKFFARPYSPNQNPNLDIWDPYSDEPNQIKQSKTESITGYE